MLKYGKILLWLFTFFNLSLAQAYAYIDPGTASGVFSAILPSLAYLLAILGTTLGILIWPIRRFFRYLNEKWNQQRKALAVITSIITTIVILCLIAIICIFWIFG